MYAYLQGRFTFKSPAQVYIDVNGVGYEVNISLNTYSSLQKLDEGKLFTYLAGKGRCAYIVWFFLIRPKKKCLYN
ncbi:MAG: OB-fold domain-containing protein [Ferruginibacter sp.]